MTIEEFIYQAGSRLREGDFLRPDSVLPAIDDCRESLERTAEELEQNPSPRGLEALDEATFEALNLLAEALDLLELAVEDEVPELAPEILVRAQDGRETLREVRRLSQTHREQIQEEFGWRG